MDPADLSHALDLAANALRAGDLDGARGAVHQARRLERLIRSQTTELGADVDRYRIMLRPHPEVTLANGLEPVANEVLDGMMAVIEARRGFLGLVTDSATGRWAFHVARHLSQEDILDPEKHVSRGVIEQVLTSGEPVITFDAEGEFSTRSVTQLGLRSIACVPLWSRDRLVGFVYMDDSETVGRFDDAAVAALNAWVPLASACVARAVSAEASAEGILPGVVTRSPRMESTLRELARIAPFGTSVLITGETGTGKSLIARRLHEASDRSAKPFIHVNCGAIPEALLEAELFGAEPGAYTGASARRIGKFEAANGGTLFLDELDTMPLACQVKLLVALQERQIQRLGGNAVINVDVRVLAAMSSDPFVAIDENRLREDLYRLAVFEARLPALRERRDDVLLLARHLLEKARQRHNLPSIVLTPEATDRLAAHDWPGNVRELENALDRAALLAEDGVITAETIRTRRRGPEAIPAGGAGGVVRTLEIAAKSLADEMDKNPNLRTGSAAGLFEALLHLELVRRHGGRDDAYRFLGEEEKVAARNHHRILKRVVQPLLQLRPYLGEEVSADLIEHLP